MKKKRKEVDETHPINKEILMHNKLMDSFMSAQLQLNSAMITFSELIDSINRKYPNDNNSALVRSFLDVQHVYSDKIHEVCEMQIDVFYTNSLKISDNIAYEQNLKNYIDNK